MGRIPARQEPVLSISYGFHNAPPQHGGSIRRMAWWQGDPSRTCWLAAMVTCTGHEEHAVHAASLVAWHLVRLAPALKGQPPTHFARDVVQQLHAEVQAWQTTHAQQEAPQLSVTFAMGQGRQVWIGHLGSTSALLLTRGGLQPLTEAHTQAALFARTPGPPPFGAPTGLTRHLGHEGRPNADVIGPLTIADGRQIILASHDPTKEESVRSHPDLRWLARRLAPSCGTVLTLGPGVPGSEDPALPPPAPPRSMPAPPPEPASAHQASITAVPDDRTPIPEEPPLSRHRTLLLSTAVAVVALFVGWNHLNERLAPPPQAADTPPPDYHAAPPTPLFVATRPPRLPPLPPQARHVLVRNALARPGCANLWALTDHEDRELVEEALPYAFYCTHRAWRVPMSRFLPYDLPDMHRALGMLDPLGTHDTRPTATWARLTDAHRRILESHWTPERLDALKAWDDTTSQQLLQAIRARQAAEGLQMKGEPLARAEDGD